MDFARSKIFSGPAIRRSNLPEKVVWGPTPAQSALQYPGFFPLDLLDPSEAKPATLSTGCALHVFRFPGGITGMLKIVELDRG